MMRDDDCTTIVRQLWPHLDGALPDDWESRVVAHLDRCGGCRSHVEFERAFLDAVRDAGARADAATERLQDRVVIALSTLGFAPPR